LGLTFKLLSTTTACRRPRLRGVSRDSRRNGDLIEGFREIGEDRIAVSGKIEHPNCCDLSHLLRLRFGESDRRFEGTYLWLNGLDNYGRISGYVYDSSKSTDWPGMEVLFRDHRAV